MRPRKPTSKYSDPMWTPEDAAKRRPPDGFNPALKGKPNALPR